MHNKSQSPKNKKQAACVFCANQGVTKQHFWPDWIKKVIPRDGDKHSQWLFNLTSPSSGSIHINPDFKVKRGPIGSKKIRNVCKSCNNGWMSRIEEKSKPLIISLMLEEHREFNEGDILSICKWAVLLSIIAEYTDIDNQAIPEKDRQSIMNDTMPSFGWNIFIGRYNGNNWKQRYKHFGMTFVPKKLNLNQKISPNAQSSTFVVGSLLIHLNSTSLPELDFFCYENSGLHKLWPLGSGNVTWPVESVLDDSDVESITDKYLNLCMIEPINNFM